MKNLTPLRNRGKSASRTALNGPSLLETRRGCPTPRKRRELVGELRRAAPPQRREGVAIGLALGGGLSETVREYGSKFVCRIGL